MTFIIMQHCLTVIHFVAMEIGSKFYTCYNNEGKKVNFCRSGFLGASEVKKNERNGNYQLHLPSGEVKNIQQ